MNEKTSSRGLFKGRPAYVVAIILLLIALPVSILVAVTFGTMKLPVTSVYTVIRYELGNILFRQPIPADWAPGTPLHDVVWLIRLPRLILAAAGDAGHCQKPAG